VRCACSPGSEGRSYHGVCPTTWVAPARRVPAVFGVGTDHAGNTALWQLQTIPSNARHWYGPCTPLGSKVCAVSVPQRRPQRRCAPKPFLPWAGRSGTHRIRLGVGLYHHCIRPAAMVVRLAFNWNVRLLSCCARQPSRASATGVWNSLRPGSDAQLFHTGSNPGTVLVGHLSHGTPPVFSSLCTSGGCHADVRLRIFVSTRNSAVATQADGPEQCWSRRVSTELHPAFCAAQTRPGRLLRAQTGR